MKKLINTLSLVLSIGFLSVAAQASEKFIANLTSGQEVPSNGSSGTGVATIVLDPVLSQFNVTVAFSGLTSNQIAGTINGTSTVGSNSAVIFNIGATNTATGTLSAVFPATTVLVQELRKHLLYVNLQTVGFPNGEIRGQLKPANQADDFDGDGRSEIGVFRPSNGNWFLLGSLTGGFTSHAWGAGGDVVVPGDYDADGRTDHAVWRSGTFYVFRSMTQTLQVQAWGSSGDDPRVSGLWDNDTVADFAVYREGTPGSPQSFFYIQSSLTGTFNAIPWGTMGDTGISGDWDGDGMLDIAMYRRATGTYYVRHSSTGAIVVQPWGNFAQDTVAPADYDGDGATDFAVFRDAGPGAGTWHILGSLSGYVNSAFGLANDVAAPGDYDGDGRSDLAVYRGGVWFINRSTAGFMVAPFGIPTDEPLPTYLTR